MKGREIRQAVSSISCLKPTLRDITVCLDLKVARTDVLSDSEYTRSITERLLG